MDPIVNAQLCKYFPALTPKQATNLCFYSMGANHQDISSLLDAAPISCHALMASGEQLRPTLRLFSLHQMQIAIPLLTLRALPVRRSPEVAAIASARAEKGLSGWLNRYQKMTAAGQSIVTRPKTRLLLPRAMQFATEAIIRSVSSLYSAY